MCTFGDKNVGKNDSCREKKASCLSNSPPNHTEHAQSQQLGRDIYCSKDNLDQVDTHLVRGVQCFLNRTL